MSLRFDPKTGLSVDDVATVREEVRQDWVQAFRQKPGLPDLRTEPETPAGQLIDSQTQAIVDKDNEVLFLGQQFNPLTAEGIWQDALGKIYFLTRKVEQQSYCTCKCTGLSGTVIPEGAVIKSTSDETEWVCAQATTIGNTGTVNVPFTCKDGGSIEAPIGTLTKIVTVTPGWDEVTNDTAASLGRIAETQAEFEQRRYNSVAKNAHGTIAAIYAGIADLNDVIDLVVLNNDDDVAVQKFGVTIPAHSIYVSVLGGAAAEIAEVLYRRKDAGCGTAGNTTVTYTDTALGAYPGNVTYSYKIQRPTALAIGFRVTIQKSIAVPSTVENLVREAIYNAFYGIKSGERVRIASTIYASRFYCPVVSANIGSLISIQVRTMPSGSWGDEVTVNANRYPSLDRASVEVVLED